MTDLYHLDLGLRTLQGLSSLVFSNKDYPLALQNFLNYEDCVSQQDSSLLFFRDIYNLTHFAAVCYSAYDEERKTPSYRQSRLQQLSTTQKVAILITLAGLLTYFSYRVLRPKTPLNQLLEKSGISNLSSKEFQVSWYKPYGEVAQTALLFARMMVTSYRCYTSKNYRKDLPMLAIDLFTLFRVASYRMLKIKYSIPNSSPQFPNIVGNFGSTMKQVDVHFYCPINPFSFKSCGESIKSIYDYSLDIFSGSFWGKNWLTGNTYVPYQSAYISPPSVELPWQIEPLRYKDALFYAVRLKKNPPCAIEIKILHEGQVWSPFKAIDIFKWIPTFFNRGRYVNQKFWTQATIYYPPSPSLFTRIKNYFRYS